jgi:hypothetical protein
MNDRAARLRRQQRLAETGTPEAIQDWPKATKPYRKPPEITNARRRPVEALPEPWLFNTQSLLKELDRCRELVLYIPAERNEAHFAINIAIDALWSLREELQWLIQLHEQMRQDFIAKQEKVRAEDEEAELRRKTA